MVKHVVPYTAPIHSNTEPTFSSKSLSPQPSLPPQKKKSHFGGRPKIFGANVTTPSRQTRAPSLRQCNHTYTHTHTHLQFSERRVADARSQCVDAEHSNPSTVLTHWRASERRTHESQIAINCGIRLCCAQHSPRDQSSCTYSSASTTCTLLNPRASTVHLYSTRLLGEWLHWTLPIHNTTVTVSGD